MTQSLFSRWTAGLALTVTTAAAVTHAQQPAVSPASAGGRMTFTEPAPLDFNDHDGYVSLFDGAKCEIFEVREGIFHPQGERT